MKTADIGKWVGDELDDLKDAYGLSRDEAISRLVEGLEADEYRDAMNESQVKVAVAVALKLGASKKAGRR
jgi:hypothetical protein